MKTSKCEGTNKTPAPADPPSFQKDLWNKIRAALIDLLIEEAKKGRIVAALKKVKK